MTDSEEAKGSCHTADEKKTDACKGHVTAADNAKTLDDTWATQVSDIKASLKKQKAAAKSSSSDDHHKAAPSKKDMEDHLHKL